MVTWCSLKSQVRSLWQVSQLKETVTCQVRKEEQVLMCKNLPSIIK